MGWGGLADLDVSRAGVGTDGWAAAVDDAGDVVAVEAALHGDGLLNIDAAGAGVGVEVETCAAADGEVDVAGAGAEVPVGGGLAVDLDVSGAGAGFECAGEAAEGDV